MTEQTIWAYVRVSTKDQNLARQLDAMQKLGICDERIIIDKASGKSFDRPGYQKLKKRLKPGDIIYIHSLDRLGRDFLKLLFEWLYISLELKVQIRILDMESLNSTDSMTDEDYFRCCLNLLLQAFIADQERKKNKIRQAEGIAAAKRRGKRFGRPEMPLPLRYHEVMQAFLEKKITGSKAAREIGMNAHTFYAKARKIKREAAEQADT